MMEPYALKQVPIIKNAGFNDYMTVYQNINFVEFQQSNRNMDQITLKKILELSKGDGMESLLQF